MNIQKQEYTTMMTMELREALADLMGMWREFGGPYEDCAKELHELLVEHQYK